MSVTAYPLCWPAGWPRAARRKVPNQAERAGFAWARTKLSTEVDRLGAADAILSSNCVLNLAGEPRGDQQPIDSGVALYFTLKGRHMAMATDHYSQVSSNLRRLALAIAYLRGLERHGGGIMVERAFAGFAALPEPGRVAPWRELMGFAPGEEVNDVIIDARYRVLARQRHPDVGGTDQQMAELNRARDMALADLAQGVGA